MEDTNTLIETIHRFARAFHHFSLHAGRNGHGARFRGQGRALKALNGNPNVSQSELAELLGIRPQSAGELLSKLERHGLVRRTESENDRRSMETVLTEAGKAAAEAEPAESEAGAGFLEALSAEERQSLGSLLAKLTDRLEAELAAEAPGNEGTYGRRGRHGFGGSKDRGRNEGHGRGGEHEHPDGRGERGRGGRREHGRGSRGAPRPHSEDQGESHRPGGMAAGCDGNCRACPSRARCRRR